MQYFTKESLNRTTQLTFLGIVVILLLYFAGSIIFPLLFALFFSFALLRPTQWLERIGLPRFLAASLLTLLGALILFVLATFIFFEGYQLVDNLKLASEGGELQSLKIPVSFIEKHLLDGKELEASNLEMISGKLFSYAGGFLQSLFSKTTSTMVFFGIIPVYVVLLLTYRGNFRLYMVKTLEKRGLKQGQQIIEEITEMIQKYLLGLATIVGIVAILYGLGLYFIGIKYAIFLATLSALLIIIPYVGSILGALIPMTIAWLTTDGWLAPVLVLSLYLLVQVLEGYVLTPIIVGKNVNLNPLVVILGMIILGSIGGITAMIIAVPLMATVKILLENSKRYDTLAILLGNGENTNTQNK